MTDEFEQRRIQRELAEKAYKRKMMTYVGLIVVVLFGLPMVFGSFFIVDSGEEGVVVSRISGTEQAAYGEGFHFKNPITEKAKILNVQTQAYDASASSASRDLQIVTTGITVNYQIKDGHAWRIWKEIGKDYESRILAPNIQSIVKGATAQFTAEELITRRSEVVHAIINGYTDKRTNEWNPGLSDILDKNYMLLENVHIVDFKFSPEFDRAIEAKVTAEQEALKAKNDLERIKFEAQQEIERAIGDAESIRIRAEALSDNPELLELERIKVQMAYAEAYAKKWDGVLPRFMSGDAGFLLNLPADEVS